MNKIYLIGNSHIDLVWQWKWQEGVTEVMATFRSALDRMKEFPDFKYTSACAAYYMWVELLDKDMFKEIQKRVKEGRWSIVGGWYIQPDCNIPSGESFARQGLISQRYFKEKFGITATTAYNVDSFGHCATLPQIFKKSGMNNYVFLRPEPKESADIADLFWWESADGSRVLSHRLFERYNIALAELPTIDRLREKVEKDGIPYMAFYGVGNHGGGPTIKLLAEMSKRSYKDEVHSTVDEYFDVVKDYNLPTVKDELQHHARGCYSAGTAVKQGNRKCENNLITAEKVSVLAKKLTGAEYPHEELNKAWRNILFNQFHDILGGCSIKAAFEDAGYLYGETMSITEGIITFALQKIAHNIDTQGDAVLPTYKIGEHSRIWEIDGLGTPIVIFNPHCYGVREVIQINDVPQRVVDEKGNEVIIQRVRGPQTVGKDGKDNYIFLAEIPAYGYTTYRLFPEGEIGEGENTLNITEKNLENNRIKVEFDDTTGDIKSFYLKDKDEYIIDRPCRAILLDETECDTWAHDKDLLGEMCGEFGKPEFEVVERGPVRAKLRVKTQFEKSLIMREYTITPDTDEVRVKTVVDFHEKYRSLKFTFPISQSVISKIPYGTIERGLETGEEPCAEFTASGRLGVANSAQYGYDTTKDELRLTVLRSCAYIDQNGERDGSEENMEQGLCEFSYSIFPFESKTDAAKRAENLNINLRHIVESFHKGYLPLTKSCFLATAENTIVTAIKEGEDKDGTVIRFNEMEDNGEKFKFKLFETTDEIEISHSEVMTVKLKDNKAEKVNLIEWEN